jgi:hypothetical protein
VTGEDDVILRQPLLSLVVRIGMSWRSDGFHWLLDGQGFGA